MRWRSGGNDRHCAPLNEVHDHALSLSGALPNVDDDEQDYSTPDHHHMDDANDLRGRLGSSPSSGLPPSANHDLDDIEQSGDSSDDPKQLPSESHFASDSDIPSSSCADSKTEAVMIEDDDDPGLDHSLPPDESSDSYIPATAWRPQNQQSTCEFTHTISNYSQKRESGCKKAEYSATTVDEFGNRWRLIVYVNGNGRASNHHLSLFLQVADADELPFGWKKAVSYVLTLEHPSGSNLGYAKRNPDKTFKLCPKAIDWGWSQFITSDRIQQEGYVSNDSLTVRASVTVKSSSVSIDSEDAELYLKCAVEEGNAEAVKACLAQGAGVNCQFKDDLYTPLHTACSSSTISGSLEVLNLLLEQGADGNACNKWRETPLLIAANNGHKAAVEALLNNRADPSLCSEAGWSALTFAAHKGYDDIVALLLSNGAPVNCRVTEDLSTPLHKACAGGKPGHLSAVKQLLEGGADVHALNKWRETPLLTAANHGQAAAVEALLQAGGDPCKCTDTGWSPLSIAAYKGHDDVVRLLLEEGAPTEEADPTLSALLQAATKGLPDTVELLLRHGADHTVTTKKGDTALSILVEQNLIDAAVEMVTEYKASVPRCSRDRKKVQRARLLINLRVKQQQREGLLSLSTDEEDDDETDNYESDGSNSALHDEDDSPKAAAPNSGKKKKKKPKANSASAEAQARAAEEALLWELEQEDAKAQKNEAAANSKRAKKKKKKERERQLKLKEEKEQKEKEEKEARERERQQKIKEDKERREREEKAKEQKEIEAKEAARLEREAASKKREADERERRQRDQEKQERERLGRLEKKLSGVNGMHPTNPPTSPGIERRTKGGVTKPKATKKQTYPTSDLVKSEDLHPGFSEKASLNGPVSPPISKSPAPSKKRGWETNNAANLPTTLTGKLHQKISSNSQTLSQPPSRQAPSSTAQVASGTDKGFLASPPTGLSVEDHLENMATGVVDFLGFDVHHTRSTSQYVPVQNKGIGLSPSPSAQLQDSISYAASGGHGGLVNGFSVHYSNAKTEIPAMCLYRQEKLAEIFQRCALARSQPHGTDPLGVLDEGAVKKAIYRWIVRASHGKTPFLDCLIPSWTNFDLLCTFFQRQFIAESRKGVSSNTAGMINMEALKDAGSAMAILCQAQAKDFVQIKQKMEEQLPHDWTDSVLSVTAAEARNGMGSLIVIDWANRAQVVMPISTFTKARDRYVGSPSGLLTAMFSATKRYESLKMIVSGTTLDHHISPSLRACLMREASVSIELFSDPFSALSTNYFWGQFPDVDVVFGGLPPFGNEDGGGEMQLLKHGGSVCVLLPFDNMVASLYMRRMIDILESADNDRLPVSFVVIVHAECFRDLSRSLAINDIASLDPRLNDRHGAYVRFAEVLQPGQHTFHCGEGEGVPEVCRTGSLFVILQNESGKGHFPITEMSIQNIFRAIHIMPSKDLSSVAQIGFSDSYAANGSITAPMGYHDVIPNRSPRPAQRVNHGDFGAIGGTSLSSAFSNDMRRGGRRGRLFELIDDGDDDNINDVDVVSGMLTNLNVNLFQNNPTQEVDIEAISLMGIGGAPLGDEHRSGGLAPRGSRTTSRFA